MVGLLLVLIHVISRTLVELRGGISRRSFHLFLYVIKYNQMLFVWLSDRTRLIQKKETSWMGLLHVDKDVLFLIANDSIASIDLIKINDILVNFNGSILSPTGPILMKKYMYVYIEKKLVTWRDILPLPPTEVSDNPRHHRNNCSDSFNFFKLELMNVILLHRK